MTMPRAALLVLACLVALASEASAQADYPSRPVRIVVNSAPGGGTDILARVLTQQLSRGGQSFFVENRAGGGGIIGIEAVHQRAARRLHAADDAEHRHRAAGGNQAGALRRGEGSGCDHPGRRHLQRAGGASGRAGEDAARADRARKGQARHAQLRLRRRGLVAAHEHGTAQAHGRHRPAAHSVQGHRPGDDRGAVRPDRGAVLQPAHRQAADRGRQTSRARDLGAEAGAGPAGRADRGRGRRAGLFGAAMVRPARARRHAAADRSTSSRPPSPRRCARPRCASGWRRTAPSRSAAGPRNSPP